MNKLLIAIFFFGVSMNVGATPSEPAQVSVRVVNEECISLNTTVFCKAGKVNAEQEGQEIAQLVPVDSLKETPQKLNVRRPIGGADPDFDMPGGGPGNDPPGNFHPREKLIHLINSPYSPRVGSADPDFDI